MRNLFSKKADVPAGPVDFLIVGLGLSLIHIFSMEKAPAEGVGAFKIRFKLQFLLWRADLPHKRP